MPRPNLPSLPSAVSTFATSAAAGLLLLLATPAMSDPGDTSALPSAAPQQQKADADDANRAGITAQNRGDLAASIGPFKQALMLSTSDASKAVIQQNEAASYATLGKQAYDRGDYDEAIGLFKQALPLAGPDTDTIRYNISESYYQLAIEAHERHDLTGELDLLESAQRYGGTRQHWIDRIRNALVERNDVLDENLRLADIPPEEEPHAPPPEHTNKPSTVPVTPLLPGPGFVGVLAPGPAVVLAPGVPVVTPPVPVPVPSFVPPRGRRGVAPGWGARIRTVQVPRQVFVPRQMFVPRPGFGGGRFSFGGLRRR